ncbi:MAG: hypothetical protein M9894_27790 [Planctomycetes bacterium]|nr:hypothetical protein [Planctomycetota bacterium]
MLGEPSGSLAMWAALHPPIAAYHHGGLYLSPDPFGRSRMLGLTRFLYVDGDDHVAVVRGDGRRNTYRWTGSAYEPAAGLQSTLELDAGVFVETTPGGKKFHYDEASGRLELVLDRLDNPVYYTYDGSSRLQRIEGLSGAQGLVPYLTYDGDGLLERLVLEDPLEPQNNRVSYFHYDSRNLTSVVGPELCVTYFEYGAGSGALLTAVTDPENYSWRAGYDGDGRVDRIADALTPPRTAYFDHDPTTAETTLVDRAGKVTYFQYGAWGSPERVWNPGTPADYHEYDDPDGNLTRSENRLTRAWTYEYDARGNRQEVTDPHAGRSYFAHDAQDLLRFYVDPLDRVTYLDYDADRNRTKWIDPVGNTAYYDYEPNGLLRAKVDRREANTYFAWDDHGNLERVTDPLGHETELEHNSAGERTAVVDPLGRVSYFDYDLRGRLTKRVDPTGAETSFAYDARCNLVAETDARSNTTEHFYDGNSNRKRTEDALGRSTYFDYDPEERLERQEDALERVTTWGYDALGRRERQTDALGRSTYFFHDAAHQLERQENARGFNTYFRYDFVGRLREQEDALGNEVYFGFDLAGQRRFTKDPRGKFTYFDYDDRGWLERTQNAIGAVTESVYDEEGNRLESRGPLPENVTYFTYDLAGRLTHTEDAHHEITETGYDEAGQVRFRKDELGAVTYSTYDLAGRQESTLDPAGLFTYHAYDAVGNLLFTNVDQGYGRQPWGSSPYGGQRATTYHTYDELNRRLTTEDPYGAVTENVYDEVGNLLETTDARGVTTTFEYDALNRRFRTIDGVHHAATYMDFDEVGNVVLQRDQKNVETTMEYDEVDRLELTKDPAGALTYHFYDEAGNRTRTRVVLGLGGEERWTYFDHDDVNRVYRQTAADGGVTYFELDEAGNQRIVIDPENRPTYFEYDALNRQTERSNFFDDTWVTDYDARSSVLRQIDPEGRTAYMNYDPARRLVSQGNALGEYSYFSYDARGSRVRVTNPRGFSTYFRYDLLGRQTHRIDALGGVTYMGYDEVGNRVLQQGPEESNFVGLFFMDAVNSRIDRVKLDGTGLTTVVPSPGLTNHLALDLITPGGKLYWIGVQHAERSDLDGSNQEAILGSSDVDTPGALVADPGRGRIYYTTYTSPDGEIRSAALTGADRQTVLAVGDEPVLGLALDPVAGKLYYTRYNAGDLRRVNVDGTGDEQLVASLSGAWGVAVDLFARKVYWSEASAGTIRRANLDGSGAETVVNGLTSPSTLGVDSVRRRLYWAEDDEVRSSDLAGADQQMVLGQFANFALALPQRVTLFSYDGLNRLSTVTDALGSLTYMGYDARSSMVLRVDADGRVTYMDYDDARRLERTWFENPVAGETADAPIYYAYDQVGNLLESDDTAAGLGVSEFEYDAMDRLVEKTTVAGVVAYEYDLSGMKTRVTDPNSEATTHAYDEAGRLIRATVLDTPNRENDFHHDRSGLIERKVLAGNKVVSYYAYDVAGRLSSLVNRDDAAAVISSFVYQRNPNGAVTQVEHEDGEFTYYAYDALDRLVEERRVQNPTVYGFAYQYDAASNRVQKVDLVEDETTNYTVDARNLIQSEVTGADEIAYEYDQAQRMKRRDSAEEATVFTHNQRDLPTKVEFEVESGTPDPNQEFHYTGTGERAVMVSSSFGPTLLAYDGTRLLLEKFAGGGTFGSYRWAGGVPIETYDGEFSAMGTPVLDERGSVERQVGLTGRVIYDRFGVEWANSLVGTTRTRFNSYVLLSLRTHRQPLLIGSTFCYLPIADLLTTRATSLVPVPTGDQIVAPPPSEVNETSLIVDVLDEPHNPHVLLADAGDPRDLAAATECGACKWTVNELGPWQSWEVETAGTWFQMDPKFGWVSVGTESRDAVAARLTSTGQPRDWLDELGIRAPGLNEINYVARQVRQVADRAHPPRRLRECPSGCFCNTKKTAESRRVFESIRISAHIRGRTGQQAIFLVFRLRAGYWRVFWQAPCELQPNTRTWPRPV